MTPPRSRCPPCTSPRGRHAFRTPGRSADVTLAPRVFAISMTLLVLDVGIPEGVPDTITAFQQNVGPHHGGRPDQGV